MLIPLSALGILTSLPGPPLTSHPTSFPTILSNLPALLLWLWLNILIRQLVNGLAYPVYGVAALKILIADAGVAEILPGAYAWLGLLGLVAGTTIQVQDLKDYEGDKARGRHTFPVILGDAFTRFGICVGIMFWSLRRGYGAAKDQRRIGCLL
ncbi:hypothetical protein CBS470a_003856 [Colletotrichum nupharicola]|nr:hypothetical protein CBS470a_003856 [Colletotrichum nupharicola]